MEYTEEQIDNHIQLIINYLKEAQDFSSEFEVYHCVVYKRIETDILECKIDTDPFNMDSLFSLMYSINYRLIHLDAAENVKDYDMLFNKYTCALLHKNKYDWNVVKEILQKKADYVEYKETLAHDILKNNHTLSKRQKNTYWIVLVSGLLGGIYALIDGGISVVNKIRDKPEEQLQQEQKIEQENKIPAEVSDTLILNQRNLDSLYEAKPDTSKKDITQ